MSRPPRAAGPTLQPLEGRLLRSVFDVRKLSGEPPAGPSRRSTPHVATVSSVPISADVPKGGERPSGNPPLATLPAEGVASILSGAAMMGEHSSITMVSGGDALLSNSLSAAVVTGHGVMPGTGSTKLRVMTLDGAPSSLIPQPMTMATTMVNAGPTARPDLYAAGIGVRGGMPSMAGKGGGSIADGAANRLDLVVAVDVGLAGQPILFPSGAMEKLTPLGHRFGKATKAPEVDALPERAQDESDDSHETELKGRSAGEVGELYESAEALGGQKPKPPPTLQLMPATLLVTASILAVTKGEKGLIRRLRTGWHSGGRWVALIAWLRTVLAAST